MSEWDLDPPDNADHDDHDDLADIGTILAEITDEDRHRIEPPPSIWNAIVDTVTADRDGQPNLGPIHGDGGNGAVVADMIPIEQQATTTISLAARTREADLAALPSDSGGWRRQWLPVAAAVAIAIVGGLVTWAFSDELADGDGTAAPVPLDGDVVATVELTNDGLAVPTAEVDEVAVARLIKVDDAYFVELDIPEVADIDGFRELWVIDPDIAGMFSLGVVTDGARLALPPGLDPGDYPVVDVSVEPLDGDPTHSGQSIWRGMFDL